MLNAFCRLLEVAAAQDPAGIAILAAVARAVGGRRRDAAPPVPGARPAGAPAHGRQRLSRVAWRRVNRMHALSPIALPPAELAAKRKRARNTLVAGVALGSTGHIAAVTVGTIVAHELIGTQALAGAPGATVVLGAALGAVLLSALMARRGRRVGLVSGYSIGVVGAFVATAAVLTRSFPLLLLGTMLIGFGNASNSLSRYTAADMVKTDRRASAIGTVVWASTVGSVVGPTLVPIAGEIALQAGLPPLAGPYLVPVVFVGLAAILSFIFLRPDPYELADEDAVALAVPGDTTTERVWSIMRRPGCSPRSSRSS